MESLGHGIDELCQQLPCYQPKVLIGMQMQPIMDRTPGIVNKKNKPSETNVI